MRVLSLLPLLLWSFFTSLKAQETCCNYKATFNMREDNNLFLAFNEGVSPLAFRYSIPHYDYQHPTCLMFLVNEVNFHTIFFHLNYGLSKNVERFTLKPKHSKITYRYYQPVGIGAWAWLSIFKRLDTIHTKTLVYDANQQIKKGFYGFVGIIPEYHAFKYTTKVKILHRSKETEILEYITEPTVPYIFLYGCNVKKYLELKNFILYNIPLIQAFKNTTFDSLGRPKLIEFMHAHHKGEFLKKAEIEHIYTPLADTQKLYVFDAQKLPNGKTQTQRHLKAISVLKNGLPVRMYSCDTITDFFHKNRAVRSDFDIAFEYDEQKNLLFFDYKRTYAEKQMNESSFKVVSTCRQKYFFAYSDYDEYGNWTKVIEYDLCVNLQNQSEDLKPYSSITTKNIAGWYEFGSMGNVYTRKLTYRKAE